MSYTVTVTGSRPPTMNDARGKKHWTQERATTEAWRTHGLAGARRVGIPQLEAFTVKATPLHKDRRSPQDVGACAPAVKAMIDGFVDAKVCPNDTPEFVPELTFTAPSICGHDGLLVEVIPMSATEAKASRETHVLVPLPAELHQILVQAIGTNTPNRMGQLVADLAMKGAMS